MKFAEGDLVIVKPDAANDINNSDVRGGKWMQADAPFTVKEVHTEKKYLLVKKHSGVGCASVRMDDAIPADVYERLPHVIAAKEAHAAAFLVWQRENSAEASEERAYRERRDFMLQHGRPMTDKDRVESLMDDVISTDKAHAFVVKVQSPISITVDGIKIGEVKQFSGNPMELKNHDDDDDFVVVSVSETARLLGEEKPGDFFKKHLYGTPKCAPGGECAPPELFDTFVTVKAKKEE